MEWENASKFRFPDGTDRQRLNIKYKGKADLIEFRKDKGWCWYDDTECYTIHEDSLSAIEWLDESSPPESQPLHNQVDVSEDVIHLAETFASTHYDRILHPKNWNRTKNGFIAGFYAAKPPNLSK